MQAEVWSKNKQTDRRTIMKQAKDVFREYAEVSKITAVGKALLFS